MSSKQAPVQHQAGWSLWPPCAGVRHFYKCKLSATAPGSTRVKAHIFCCISQPQIEPRTPNTRKFMEVQDSERPELSCSAEVMTVQHTDAPTHAQIKHQAGCSGPILGINAVLDTGTLYKACNSQPLSCLQTLGATRPSRPVVTRTLIFGCSCASTHACTEPWRFTG